MHGFVYGVGSGDATHINMYGCNQPTNQPTTCRTPCLHRLELFGTERLADGHRRAGGQVDECLLYYVGSDCMERVTIFHFLVHFRLRLLAGTT